MGKLLDRLRGLHLARRKDATLLFEALRRAAAERDAARLAVQAIAEAAETPQDEAAPAVEPPGAN